MMISINNIQYFLALLLMIPSLFIYFIDDFCLWSACKCGFIHDKSA